MRRVRNGQNLFGKGLCAPVDRDKRKLSNNVVPGGFQPIEVVGFEVAVQLQGKRDHEPGTEVTKPLLTNRL